MGPRSENRGYVAAEIGFHPGDTLLQWVHGPRTVVMAWLDGDTFAFVAGFNGSTVREPWLCPVAVAHEPAPCAASMGPRSENRGYGRRRIVVEVSPVRFNGSTVREPWLCNATGPWAWMSDALQWVHGPRTVVMSCSSVGPGLSTPSLQWVHGPRTVVMEGEGDKPPVPPELQWVHGPRTVVMRPRRSFSALISAELQWVHGPRTVVMGHRRMDRHFPIPGFNGSTVREPWLCEQSQYATGAMPWASMGPRSENRGYAGRHHREGYVQAGASMGPRSENRGYAIP